MLTASEQSQKNGFIRQQALLNCLQTHHHPDWVESRLFLSGSKGNINFLEKKLGDLWNPTLGISLEVQTSENPSHHVGWMKSKYLYCQSKWQCFFYDLPRGGGFLPLIISTDDLKNGLGPIDGVSWTDYGNDEQTLIWHEVLRKWGALDLKMWIEWQPHLTD